MGRYYRIRVSGAPRRNLDPVLLAQVVIVLGRHLQQQRQQQARRDTSDAGTGQSLSGCPVPPDQGADGDG